MRGFLLLLLTLILSAVTSNVFAQTDIIIGPGGKPAVVGVQDVRFFPQGVNAQSLCATSCSGSVTTMRFFDGNLGCSRTVNLPCNPYACDTAGKACNKACSANSDCSSGNVCNKSTGQCVIPTYRCSDDGNAVIGSDGSETACHASKCRAGNCILFCDNSLDCKTGFTCDPRSRTCVVYSPE